MEKLKVYVTVLKEVKNSVLGFADVVIYESFRANGLRIMTGKNGQWVAMPSRKLSKPNKDGDEYVDVFHPVTKTAREVLFKAVLDAFEKKSEAPPKDEAAAEAEGEEVPF